MGENKDFDLDEKASPLGNIIVFLVTLSLVGLVAVGLYWGVFHSEKEVEPRQEPIITATPIPTQQPTEAPTMIPTQAPTTIPTESPTQEPVIEEMPTDIEQNIQEVPIDIEAGHSFHTVSEIITAKEATNLRNMPGQGEDSQVILTLYNGQTATRIGISDSGWSKVEYNGEIYYAVSSYLTTDLTPSTPVPEEEGIKTVFTPCEEMVSPKIEVNLRTLPSVTNPESVVVVKLPYGAVVKRTGINSDVGWSQVEYEGQILYCVSSYVYVVEAPVE